MTWKTPLDILETKVEDSALMPFSEIQDVFEKMMRVTYEAQSANLDNLTCEINAVSLEMNARGGAGLHRKRAADPGLETFMGRNFGHIREKRMERANRILLCINAIDGSVIDTIKGY